uniref:Chemokine interleukin-8-like domain-containing protein n=1 Tax=Astyanax mexicanus TaxID=7994 RepID=A0A8B9GUD2_ASTMX
MRTKLLCLTAALLLKAILCQGEGFLKTAPLDSLILFSPFLLLTALCHVFLLPAFGPCCFSTIRQDLPISLHRRIESYSVFTIKNGKTFCADPENLSVKKAMAFLDAKKRTLLSTTTAFRPDDIGR